MIVISILPSTITEMMQTPYYIHYSTPRMMVHKMVTSKYFDLAISAVIGLNVITMAMEFYMMPRVSLYQMYIICSSFNIYILITRNHSIGYRSYL